MKRALVILALLTMVAQATAGPAFAAGAGHGRIHRHGIQRRAMPVQLPGRQRFTLTGIIVDMGAGTITVEIHNGNRFVKEYVGGELTVQVADDTEYRLWTPSGCVPIDPDDVEIGDTTSIHGALIEGIFWARRITVGVPQACCTR